MEEAEGVAKRQRCTEPTTVPPPPPVRVVSASLKPGVAEASSAAPGLRIGGCTVRFPPGLKPHPPQLAMCSALLNALKSSQHALLESPTGTGKSLSLLCSVLAWQDTFRVPPAPGEPPQEVPKVFLCSRTHSQLRQLLAELKSTPYRPKYTVLGSRQQFCDKREVVRSKGGADLACKLLRKTTDGCPYHQPQQAPVSKLAGLLQNTREIWDLEDLDSLAATHNSCRFYGTRGLLKQADLIFCPYNYIFDPKIAKALQLNFDGAAVVIDEGHNIMDVCRESASTELTLKSIKESVEELTRMSRAIELPSGMNELTTFMQKFLAWTQKTASELRTDRWGKKEPVSLSARQALTELKTRITCATGERATSFSFLLDSARDQLAALQANMQANGVDDTGMTEVTTCEEVMRCVELIIACDADGPVEASDIRIQLGPAKSLGVWTPREDVDGNLMFCLWCFNPALVFAPLAKQARCVVVTSGTLSPMQSFQGELGVPFPIKLEAPHIIPARQVFVQSFGGMGDLTNKVTSKTAFADDLGALLQSYAAVVPMGMLVFFPSYPLMERVLATWHANGRFNKLNSVKQVLSEPHSKEEFEEVIGQYYEVIRQGGGAMMLAVYRGKVSEGINFKYENARAVLLLGIPFPPFLDPKVTMKKAYNDARFKIQQQREAQRQQQLRRPYAFDPNVAAAAAPAAAPEMALVSGAVWYKQQGFRAYNQALGRCIRNQMDYGAMILVDARFSQAMSPESASNVGALSKWVRPRVRDFSSQRDAVAHLTHFFAQLAVDPTMGRLVSERLPPKQPLQLALPADNTADAADVTGAASAEDMPAAVSTTYAMPGSWPGGSQAPASAAEPSSSDSAADREADSRVAVQGDPWQATPPEACGLPPTDSSVIDLS